MGIKFTVSCGTLELNLKVRDLWDIFEQNS